MLSLNILKDFAPDSTLIFASLPDMGMVGGLTSSFLATETRADLVATITLAEKPWVNVKDGVVFDVIDTFNIFYSKDKKMLILTGNNQPEDPRELFGLCNMFLDFCTSRSRVKRLYTAGGSLNEQSTGEPKVVGVVTNQKLKDLLLKSDIDVIGKEISTITWFNGLILGLAMSRKIDGIGFYGEISDKAVPQPLAAKSIIKAFARLEGLKIDTKPLDRQYEDVLDNLEKRKGNADSRPGIG
ncbi:MAG TPA: PAC2 family protein [Nitrososphaeraceae archaeon]|jgi:proteasome assembly chaperone (PAC2) family protein